MLPVVEIYQIHACTEQGEYLQEKGYITASNFFYYDDGMKCVCAWQSFSLKMSHELTDKSVALSLLVSG